MVISQTMSFQHKNTNYNQFKKYFPSKQRIIGLIFPTSNEPLGSKTLVLALAKSCIKVSVTATRTRPLDGPNLIHMLNNQHENRWALATGVKPQ